MSEETLIKNFLINPKNSTFEMIRNKELALSRLTKTEESEEKLAFLMIVTQKKMRRYLFNIVEKNYVDLFSTTLEDYSISKDILIELANYAAFHGRNQMVKKLFDIGVRDWKQAAKCAQAEEHSDTYELCINFSE